MKQLCAICGIRVATTKDHVPPKGIFAKPRPSNLITVPACHECNNHSSVLDETFLVNLGIHVSIVGGEGARLFNKHVLPTLQHNNKLLNKIMAETKPINLKTPDGEIHEGFFAGKWDSEAHAKVIERIIRGLHYHHYREILGVDSTVKTHYFQSLTQELSEMSINWANNTLGNNDVIYKYTSASNGDVRISVWIFQFYGAHWAGGTTKTHLGSENA